MNLHGNSQPARDVHVVRINSVTSNERRRRAREELRPTLKRRTRRPRAIDPGAALKATMGDGANVRSIFRHLCNWSAESSLIVDEVLTKLLYFDYNT